MTDKRHLRNFTELEVGGWYEQEGGSIENISQNGTEDYPFISKSGKSYVASGDYCSDCRLHVYNLIRRVKVVDWDAPSEVPTLPKAIPTDDFFVGNVAGSYRHDFGILDEHDKRNLIFIVQEMIRAINNNLPYHKDAPINTSEAKPVNLADKLASEMTLREQIDTYRRDLIARIYGSMIAEIDFTQFEVNESVEQMQTHAIVAIIAADTLIETMERGDTDA